MLVDSDTEEVLKKRYPEAVALIVSCDSDGKVNLCPVGFFSLVTWEPKIWGVSLYKKNYTTKVLSETHEFVLCIPSIEQTKDVMYCGATHGWDTDKTKNVSFQFQDSKCIQPPLVDGSLACFECKVVKEVEVEDHIIFMGEVVVSYRSEKDWTERMFNLNDRKFGMIKVVE